MGEYEPELAQMDTDRNRTSEHCHWNIRLNLYWVVTIPLVLRRLVPTLDPSDTVEHGNSALLPFSFRSKQGCQLPTASNSSYDSIDHTHLLGLLLSMGIYASL